MDALKCEAFIAAAEQGSFTLAAETLGYTQSGITRMISALEEELGFSLFIRSKRGVSLSENGMTMLPICRELVRAHKQAEAIGADIRGSVRGTIVIGSYYSVSALLLPTILKEFSNKYPGVQIKLQEGGNKEMSRWLNENSVDICYCAQPHDVNCDWLPIFSDELVAWLPKNHPYAGKESYPIEKLAEESFIHTQPGNDNEIDRLLEEYDIHPYAAYSTRDAFTTYNMVAKGIGISFNQKLISTKWIKQIAEVPFDPPQYVSLGLAVPSLKEASPAAKRFIQIASLTNIRY